MDYRFQFDINIHLRPHTADCQHGKRPGRPLMPTLAGKRALGMGKFGIKFGLSNPGAADVSTREMTITINSVDPPTVKTMAGSTLITEEFVFNDGDQLSVTLIDIDAHGNRSVPSAAFVYTVVDDIPPPQPGPISVAAKRQID